MKNRNKGFTLVELIVILVILAILVAILVPTMVKYIKKADEKTAIVECRQVVLAAQGIATELYADKRLEQLNDNDQIKKIRQ